VVAAEVGAVKVRAAAPDAHHAQTELGEPDSGHVCLSDEAIETPLQFPKRPEMIFQLRKASFAGEKRVLEICELGAASRVGFAILDLREEARH
jgi:hypothetical protein